MLIYSCLSLSPSFFTSFTSSYLSPFLPSSFLPAVQSSLYQYFYYYEKISLHSLKLQI